VPGVVGSVAISGGVFVAMGFVSNAAETALIGVADSNQPTAVLALDQLQGRTPVVWTITALVAVLSLAIQRTGLVERWLGVAGLVAAAIFLLGSVFSVLGRSPEGSLSLLGSASSSAGCWCSAPACGAPRQRRRRRRSWNRRAGRSSIQRLSVHVAHLFRVRP
jgi:hypothetical protein